MAAVSIDAIDRAAADVSLQVFGALHDGEDTVILLGPREPGFWPRFTRSLEYQDGGADPLDRWSKRHINALAARFTAKASFPSDGPPYPPFIDWATRSGRSWVAPVGLLVHDIAGLMVSFRGALIFDHHLSLPGTNNPSPCELCADQPCLSACPVGALNAGGYDVSACKTHVGSEPGIACLETGCLARQSCPVSASYGRLKAQSSFHMQAFVTP